jgi:hypothetical protein
VRAAQVCVNSVGIIIAQAFVLFIQKHRGTICLQLLEHSLVKLFVPLALIICKCTPLCTSRSCDSIALSLSRRQHIFVSHSTHLVRLCLRGKPLSTRSLLAYRANANSQRLDAYYALRIYYVATYLHEQ